MEQVDLESVAKLFGDIQTLQSSTKQMTPEESKELASAFDQHVNMVMGTLHNRLDSLQSPQQKEGEVLLARHGLYDICFQEIITHTAQFNFELSNVLRNLRLAHSEIMQAIPIILQQEEPESLEEVRQLKEELQASREESTQLLEAAEQLEKDTIDQKTEITNLVKQIKKLKQENNVLRRQKMSGTRNGSAQVYLSPKKKTSPLDEPFGSASEAGSPEFVQGRRSGSPTSTASVQRTPLTSQDDLGLRTRISSFANSLTAPSERTLDSRQLHCSASGISAAHSGISNAVSGVSGVPSRASGPHSRISGAPSQISGVPSQISGAPSRTSGTPSTVAQHLIDPFQQAGINLLSRPPDESMDDSRSLAEGFKTRTLTFRQLKEMIDQIYASKDKCDELHRKTKQPRETMEQHIYTFLNQKYGLKNLIIEYAAAIIKAVQKYAANDNDVAVFGKIISNEIDEDFRLVQKQLKQTVRDLLRVHLKGKYPLKADGAINSLLNQKIGGVLLNSEWSDIVKYMYNDEDSAALSLLIRSNVRSNPSDKEDPEKAGKIPFKHFMNVLLDFQLHGQIRFLEKFRGIFSVLDNDCDGLLDRMQFQELCQRVSPNSMNDAKMQKLMKKADPFSSNQVTYSDCVNCLSADILDMMLESMSQKAIVGSSTQSVLNRGHI